MYYYDNSKGYWNGKREKIKKKYPIITDENLEFREGKEAEIMELLAYKLGKTINEMRLIIAEL